MHAPQLGEVIQTIHSRKFAKEVEDGVGRSHNLRQRGVSTSTRFQREVRCSLSEVHDCGALAHLIHLASKFSRARILRA